MMPNHTPMTIRQAIIYADQELQLIEDSLTIIYSILSHAISISKEDVWRYPDTFITPSKFNLFLEYVDRVKRHEPLAYILGYADFYDLRFLVNRDTLIPRPESEVIVDKVLDLNPIPSVVVDVGTGSGCIGLTLAHHLPQSQVYAIDVSSAALEVARANASRLNISNITLLEGSLLESLKNAIGEQSKVDVIVANLPYISDGEFDGLSPSIKHYEPALALRSGDNPDHLNNLLIEQAADWLAPGGTLLYETTNGLIVSMRHQPSGLALIS